MLLFISSIASALIGLLLVLDGVMQWQHVERQQLGNIEIAVGVLIFNFAAMADHIRDNLRKNR
jgi:hypothetical protein